MFWCNYSMVVINWWDKLSSSTSSTLVIMMEPICWHLTIFPAIGNHQIEICRLRWSGSLDNIHIILWIPSSIIKMLLLTSIQDKMGSLTCPSGSGQYALPIILIVLSSCPRSFMPILIKMLSIINIDSRWNIISISISNLINKLSKLYDRTQ